MFFDLWKLNIYWDLIAQVLLDCLNQKVARDVGRKNSLS